MLLEEREDGTYYNGPLEPAKRLAAHDRRPAEGWATAVNGERFYSVLLGELDRDPSTPLDDWRDVAEFGAGETPEEAWRYALGAMFGPVDAEYDEESLRQEILAERE